MKPAISIVGGPGVGKSEISKPFNDRIIYTGGIIRSLPPGELRSKCENYLNRNETIPEEVLGQVFDYHLDVTDISSWDLVIVDGTPRDLGGIRVLERLFDLQALIEIKVDEEIWAQRAIKIARERPDRPDSTFENLQKRMDVYQRQMEEVRPYFFPDRYHVVNNSGNIEDAKRELRSIMEGYY